MLLCVRKALDPTEDWQFNQKHPRAYGGKFGPKPVAVQMQQEAQVPDTSGDPAESEEVDTGTNEQDAKVAVSKESAKLLKKDLGPVAPGLVVVFGDRADATKFAIAAEHALASETPLRVTAVANGKYHVEPEGMTAQQIDALQEQIHARVPLSEIKLDQALQEDAPEEKEAPPAPMPPAESPVAETDTPDLQKGLTMAQRQLLLLNVKEAEHDSMENDGKALPLGTKERITDPVGAEETITEPTAKYPRTGHKQARRPRLILKAIARQADAHESFPKGYPDESDKYADPVNKKYPVDTAERAAAAWRYINMPKNAAEYAGGGLNQVKDKIRRACKRYGVNSGSD